MTATRFTADQAAQIVPVGATLALGGSTYRVAGYSLVPVSSSYGNQAGDHVDVRLESRNARGEVTGRTFSRVTAADLARLAR